MTASTSSLRTASTKGITVEQVSAWVSERPPQQACIPDMRAPALKKIYTKNNETARYTYTDATGHPLFYVVRFEPKALEPKILAPKTFGSEGSTANKPTKMTLPLSYGSQIGAPAEWRFKKYIAPSGAKTPLYNLKELNDRPQAPILIVEGEKTADAAKQIFPEMVVTTWHGGASAVHHSDWTSLKDRKVILWPDNDIAGKSAAQQIQSRCKYAGVKDSMIIELTFEGDQPTLPPKWDLADALPNGLTLEDIKTKVTTTISTLRANLSLNLSGKAPTSTPTTKTMDWDVELGD